MPRTLCPFRAGLAAFALMVLCAGSALAKEFETHLPLTADDHPIVVPMSIKDHRFDPSHMTLMPGLRYILRINNKDDSAEEFESHYLKREKIIPGKSTVDVAIGPLKPGVYDFIGEYHQDTANGRITVPHPNMPFETVQ
jgi:hypothetical protein